MKAVKEINFLSHIFQKTVFHRERTVFWIWMSFGLIYAIVKLLIGKYNNYKIFENVFPHVINGLPLYVEYPTEYYDVNHYGPIFALVIAPFSILPEWLGMIFWILMNTYFLFYAIRQLPFNESQRIIVYWYSLCELMTAQGVQQFNISVAAFIILSFVLIEKEKEFWASCLILLGTLIKIYPIVGLAFFFFSKHKLRLVFSCVFWGCLFLVLPIFFSPGTDYISSQYIAWLERLEIKNGLNMFAISQNISLLGIVRKLTGCSLYSDLWLIIPGLILFFIPYFRIQQYKYLRFRLMLLANVLLYVVLFSTGSEASGYITLMIGVAIWYICSPSVHKRYNRYLFFTTLIFVALCSTELVPPGIRHHIIGPYALKAWPCTIVCFTICYEMIFLDFKDRV